MNKKIIASVLAVAFAVSMAGSASAITVEELQAKIQDLFAQIATLQQQSAQTQGQTGSGVCFYIDLAKGTTSSEVSKLQNQLKLDPAIYPEGLVTGYFGPLTEKAVKTFQTQNSIITTGYVGPLTRAKLNLLCSGTTHYSCQNLNDAGCVEDPRGFYTSKEQCQASCKGMLLPPSTIPPTTTKYSCNISTRQCYADVNGSFTLSKCQNICPIADPILPTCTDSDGGKNYYVKGTVTYNGRTYTDSCDPLYKCESGDLSRCIGSPSVLKEYYCENNEVKNTDYTCSSGYTCQDGACKTSLSTPSITVLSPNGGETFQQTLGSQTTVNSIDWIGGPFSSVQVFLASSSCTLNDCSIVGEIWRGTSSLSHIVWNGSTVCKDFDLPSGNECSYIQPGNYKIYILGNLPSINGVSQFSRDVSNNYFSIVNSIVPSCTDSDGGKNYNVKGTATGLYGSGKEIGIIWGENPNKCSARWDTSLNYSIHYDCCSDSATSKQLNEAYCDANGILQAEGYTCPYGCQDGACQLAGPKINLTIDPSSIYDGQSTTINWSVSPIDNISYCRASGGSGDWFGIKTVSGQEIIHPVRNNYKDYVLSCFDKNGQGASESAGVAFLSTTTTTIPTITASISIAPPSVVYNGSASLYWNSSNARYCTASASPLNNQWTGIINLSGVKNIINLTETTTFSITCNGLAGSTPVSSKATVYIKSCTDSDGGKNYYVKGTTIGSGSGFSSPINEILTKTDSCWNCNNLAVTFDSCDAGPGCCVSDWYCDGYNLFSASLSCPNGCKDGACNATVTTKYSCNTSTRTCSEDSKGAYSSLKACLEVCRQASCSVTATANPNPIPTGKNQTTVSAASFSATSLDKCKIGSLSLPHQFTQSGSSQVYTVSCTGISGYGNCSDEITVTKQGTTTKPTCSVTATANPNPIPTGKNQTTVSAASFSATSLDKCKIGSLSLPHQFTQSGSSQVYTVSCTGISGYGNCSDEITVTKQGTPSTTKYSCNTSTWTCYQNSNGVYPSLASCKLNCPRSTAIYSCNKTVWACYVDTATGEYFAIEDCQANCIKPTPPTGRCSDGSACSWCGNQCVKVTSGMMCPQVMPPTGATCACVNNSCVQVYTRTSAINDVLNKLRASLISLIELLKR